MGKSLKKFLTDQGINEEVAEDAVYVALFLYGCNKRLRSDQIVLGAREKFVHSVNSFSDVSKLIYAIASTFDSLKILQRYGCVEDIDGHYALTQRAIEIFRDGSY